MTKPIPRPETVKVYVIMTMVGTKFQFVMNSSDVMSNNTWATKEQAQHQQLIETMKMPSQKFEVYEIEWPLLTAN